MANVYGSDSAETLDAADGVTNGSDTIFGFGGSDIIYGLGGNDEIKGGGGADAIYGGSGTDTANYSDSGVGVLVSLETNQGLGGTAQGDTLNSIENLTGSAHADWLIGNDGVNVLTGLEDDDALKGAGGDDTLYGDSGNDLLVGGVGADHLYGGSGIDTANYYDSNAAVVVQLYIGAASGGHADGDTFSSVENVTGSGFNDLLFGADGVANALRGGNGQDTLKGLGGNDTLEGQNDNDWLYGGVGSDTLNGGDGNDTLQGDANADFLTGGAGNDTFVFHPGNVGDIVMDFNGNGALAGDQLVFDDFGPGATLTQLDAWTWQITYNGGASSELLAFDNAASIHPSDYMFI